VSACPGRCNPRNAGVVLGEPVWCGPCSAVVRAALRRLPSAYEALLSVSVIKPSPTDTLRVSGSRERPSPSAAVDLRDELFQTTRSWEDSLRQHLRHRAARDLGERGLTLVSAVRYLNRNFERMMCRQECAADFGHEVNVLFSTSLRLVKNGPLRALLSIPCPFCKRKCLMQQEGLAGVPWYTACEQRLGGCGRLFTEQEMEWMVHVRVAVQR
jgi:hypothetical protein